MAARQNVQNRQLDQQASAVPEHVRRHIAQQAIDSQRAVQVWPYWSTWRMNAARTGSGPYTFTIKAGTRKCFNYKIGDVSTSAGFASTYTLGKAETNLQKPSETVDKAEVKIWGLAAEICPTSDPYLAMQLVRFAFVEYQLNSGGQQLVAPLSRIPAAGGLYGQASSALLTPPLANDHDLLTGHMNNGNPTAGNHFRLPLPLIWAPDGRDSALTFMLTIDADIAKVVTERSAGTGIQAFSAPADGAAYVDVRLFLVSVNKSERSPNA